MNKLFRGLLPVIALCFCLFVSGCAATRPSALAEASAAEASDPFFDERLGSLSAFARERGIPALKSIAQKLTGDPEAGEPKQFIRNLWAKLMAHNGLPQDQQPQ